MSEENFLVLKMSWPKSSLVAVPANHSCVGGGHGKIVMENHAGTSVNIEAGVLIAKVRKN